MSKKYVIFGGIDKNVDDQPMFWNNQDGWGYLSTATHFSKEEVEEQGDVIPIYNDETTPVWVELPEEK